MTYDELTKAIRHHNECYWHHNAPEISDQEYDALLRELAAIAPEDELLKHVGAPEVAGLGPVRRLEPMLSLDKAYSLAEILKWAHDHARTGSEPILIQPKYDGISGLYEDGVLTVRGDLSEENISDKLPLMQLEAPGGYIGPVNRPSRGEILIRKDRFLQLREIIRNKSGRQYKNSRNILGGIMTLKSTADLLAVEFAMKQSGAWLSFVDYDLISYRTTLDELEQTWAEWVEKIEDVPYPIDGIVLKFADMDFRRSLGSTAHHPRGEIAFKFTNLRRESKLIGVDWSFGKNCLTPIGRIEPVELGGITIRNVSLHNALNILTRELMIGDRVVVERAGDVIPYIVETSPGEVRENAMIDRCPSCSAQLEMRGPELCCPNPDCFEIRLRRLTAAVKSAGIEHLDEATVRKMMRALNVRELADVFTLAESDLRKLDNFGDLMAANLANELRKARRMHDYQLLAALNIPHIGLNMARQILAGHSLTELRELPVEALQAIDGVGPERAEAIRREFLARKDEIDTLLNLLQIISNQGNKDQQRTVCFTGKMPEKRAYYEKLARLNGFEPVEHVTGELSLLVAADSSAHGGKMDKASALHVPVTSLKEWLAGLAEHPSDDEQSEQLTLF